MVSLTPAQSPLSHPSSSSLLICTSLSLLYSQHGVFHPCTAPLPAPPATLLGTHHMAPGPAPISVPTGVGRKGSAVPTRPSTAHLLCPWRQGVEVREGSASAALELWLRTGWTCWRFPWFLSAGTVERCGVRLGGLSNTRAPSVPGRRLFSPPHVSFLFFAQESSESTNTTIEDEDTKGTSGGKWEGRQIVLEGCPWVWPPLMRYLPQQNPPPSNCLRAHQKLL